MTSMTVKRRFSALNEHDWRGWRSITDSHTHIHELLTHTHTSTANAFTPASLRAKAKQVFFSGFLSVCDKFIYVSERQRDEEKLREKENDET